MSEKSNKFLEVKDLVVEYQSDGQTVHAVNGVSLHLDHGKTLGLVGETGAGKTTIAKSILRILPDVGCKVTGGEIHLDGQELLTLHENEMRKIRGMKQRVVIAIALACNPDLLLADEPTTALDVTIQAQVLDLIADLRKKYNTSMLLITHDLGVVAQVCDEVAVIYAGNIVEYGTKEQIFDHPTHPYTIGLFGAIPDMNEDEEWLHPIDGLPPDPTNLPQGCAFAPRCKYATDACRKSAIPMQQTADGHACRCCRMAEIAKQEG